MIAHEIDRWASAMHALRPDWRHDSLRTFATNHLAAKPYRDALVAGVWVATDPEARTPNLLKADGPWWAACQPPAAVKPTESVILTYCGHGEPGTRCTECYPRIHTGVGPSPEQRAAIRAALANPTAPIAEKDDDL